MEVKGRTESGQFVELLRRLNDHEALIGVIGLGYVGLPLCLSLGEAGCRVLGFDVDQQKASSIERGESYLPQFHSSRVSALRDADLFDATSDMRRLDQPDAIIICVPTPLTAHREPDLSFVKATTECIAEVLRPRQLIVLESTTYPGTTVEIVKPILERGGLKVGGDIWLAFSPEREDPGNLEHQTHTIPKIVGADDEESRCLVEALYGSFVSEVVPVSQSATAEAVKITENIFRAVNIALVNELKLLYGRMGINIWEVIDAAKTKPFGYMPFYPGPGLGGHCIPIDPFYLSWKAREFGLSTRFIELAGQINTSMPEHVVGELARALDVRLGKPVSGARLLMIGVAYKKNIADVRESPALKLIEMIEARGARVDFHDPHVPVIPSTREHGALKGRKSVELTRDQIANSDAVLIVTDHDDIDYLGIARSAKLVVDTRNACARAGAPLDIVVPA